jgi:hypothetical protein
LTNDDFEIALINSNENNFLLQDFANELAKEVIGDILTTPFNHCDTNHDVLFDYSNYLQDKHDSYKADDTVIFAEVTAVETGIILLIVCVKNIMYFERRCLIRQYHLLQQGKFGEGFRIVQSYMFQVL